jgi:Fe-Mn family superoxide dismutase
MSNITPTHTAKNFEHLIGQIQGLSEKQLRAHFGLYEGYVKKINEIEVKLRNADWKTANYSYSEYSELIRRMPVPYNGAYLHEIYFEALTGKHTEPSPELKQAIEHTFGSLENWAHHARAGLISAPGWVLLVRSKRDGTLRNDLVEEHHRGVLIDQDVLLALDGWEHAYMIDYGTSKAEYIQVLEKSIDWSIANRRFQTSQRTGLMAA